MQFTNPVSEVYEGMKRFPRINDGFYRMKLYTGMIFNYAQLPSLQSELLLTTAFTTDVAGIPHK